MLRKLSRMVNAEVKAGRDLVDAIPQRDKARRCAVWWAWVF